VAPNGPGKRPPRTLRLVVAYDGSEYCGWQVQPQAPTIQGTLLRAARTFDPAARLTGASRTDAGVHALRQAASLDTQTSLSPETVRRALNANIPPDIRVRDVSEARAGFNARREASAKRYAYLIDAGEVADPLVRRFAWHVPQSLDASAMRAALAALHGRHDFSAFCAAPGRDADPVCTLLAAHLIRRRGRLAFLLSADRFLHHMVRNIVGSVVAVGRGTHDPSWLAAILCGRDRRRAAPTPPAQGLTLVRVLYRRDSSDPLRSGADQEKS
jgi:tRNA pseudouridine38-40 synthase